MDITPMESPIEATTPFPEAPAAPPEEPVADDPVTHLVARLQEVLQQAPPPVPAGSGRPLGIDPEQLPATEKIRLGLIAANRQ